MKRSRIRGLMLGSVLYLLAVSPSLLADCGEKGVALQILGSGGPFGVGRASSGYLIWVDGVSRIMVDAGGGTFARFHETSARISDLKVLALSHFHPDHSSEVPALLWVQSPNLVIVGPSGNTAYPSVDQFLRALFAAPNGAFRVIGEYVEMDTVTVDVGSDAPTEVYSDGHITIRGIGVPHANVPTLGFRVDIDDASIAFSSDQIGTNAAFTKLIRDVDVLVVHFAASEESEQFIATLHAKPSVWGQMASEADARSVVLSHIIDVGPDDPRYSMFSGSDLEGSIEHLRSHYDGPLTVAEDLLCVAVE